MNTHELGQWLQHKRVERKMSMQELADACRLNLVTLYRIERGGSLPVLWVYARMTEALGISADEAMAIASQVQRRGHKPMDRE